MIYPAAHVISKLFFSSSRSNGCSYAVSIHNRNYRLWLANEYLHPPSGSKEEHSFPSSHTKEHALNTNIPDWFLPATVSPAAGSLIVGLLQCDPAFRLSAFMALQHPWCLGLSELPPSYYSSLSYHNLNGKNAHSSNSSSPSSSPQQHLTNALIQEPFSPVALSPSNSADSTASFTNPLTNHLNPPSIPAPPTAHSGMTTQSIISSSSASASATASHLNAVHSTVNQTEHAPLTVFVMQGKSREKGKEGVFVKGGESVSRSNSGGSIGSSGSGGSSKNHGSGLISPVVVGGEQKKRKENGSCEDLLALADFVLGSSSPPSSPIPAPAYL